jgi:HSP20 family molecular chaperone IbpA
MIPVRIKLEPDLCVYLDDQSSAMIVEFALPDIPKENIKIKMNSRLLILWATADGVEYSKSIPLYYHVDIKKVKTTYNNRLLRIEVPLRA